MSATTVASDILFPAEAAARLRVTVPTLVALLRKYRYGFTELAPGGRPGDRGRNRWGLSEAQFATVKRGQERAFAEPEAASKPASVPLTPESPDGKDRLSLGRRKRS